MYNHSVRIKTPSVIDSGALSGTFGITNLETDDPIFGKSLASLSPADAEDIRDIITGSLKKIVLHTVRIPHTNYDEYVSAFRNAHRLGIENIKICIGTFPEVPDIAALKKIIAAAKAFNIGIMFEPRAKYPVFTDDTYRALRDENTGLIFDASEYLRLGMNPFLTKLYKYKLKDDIKFIRINDLRTDGTPVLPEKGNAEIKEICSAMLARGFSGYFSFRQYADDIPLEDVLDAFRKMIREM